MVYLETTKLVITLAPPLLPLPLDLMARRILKQLLPSGVPCSGSTSKLSKREAKSCLKEGYFLASRFNYLSNGGMERIL